MRVKSVLFFFVFCIISNARVATFGMLGPVDFIYKSAEQCPDEPSGITVTVSGRRIDRTNMALNVFIDSPYDFDNDVGIKLTGSQLLDGGYKENAFTLNERDACKVLGKLMGDVFRDFKKQANCEDCPCPKGKYVLNDFVIDNGNFNVPQVYGDYRMKVETTYKGVPQSCFYAYYQLKPKNKF